LSKDEDALATVGSAGVGSAYNTPSRVIPQTGQVAEDTIESSPNMSSDVLQEDVSGS